MFYNRGLHLSRRALLRGAGGIALSLPFLEAMTPAVARAQTAAAPRRLGFIYFPNGYIKEHWTPATEGDYALTRALQPLAPFKDRVNVITGLACDPAKTTAGFHDRAICSFMTGVELIRGKGASAVSVDQIAAPVLSKDVPFSSLEIGIQELGQFGGPSFKSATNRLPVEINPRYLFERLFGDADRLEPAVLADLRKRQRSILDAVSSDAATVRAMLGSSDRQKVAEYMDSVRDIERRLAVMDKLAAKEIKYERPAGTPDNYGDHVKMMIDLQVIALQTDLTRVWTFMLGMEASDMTYSDIGWGNSHHLTSHHGGRPDQIEGLAQVNRYQVELLTYLLAKMDAVKEQDGKSLLDNSLLMYGSSLGDGNRHMQVDLPVLLVGGQAMGVKGGRHLKVADNTPIVNLYLSMMDEVGVNVDKMGDSTGRLVGISDV
jgi:hypothetical protein